MSRLILIRHGQIEANIKKLWHGSTDSPLTEHGRAEARKTAERIKRERPHIKYIYTSPLQRTRHTAEAIGEALGIKPQPEPDLIEYGIGELEGIHYLTLAEEHKFFEKIAEDHHYTPPGGESLHNVFTRMREAFFRIAQKHAGEETIIVSHGAAMGMTLGHLLDDNPLNWGQYPFRNCSVSELCLKAEPKLISFNTVTHLEA